MAPGYSEAGAGGAGGRARGAVLAGLPRLDCAWPVWLLALGALALLAALWWGVLWKIGAEERAAEQELDRHTANLARVFEEHTVRTLGMVDQALLLVKYGYEREGETFDVGAAAARTMTMGHLYNQVGVIDANGIYRLSSLEAFEPVDLRDREHFRVHADGAVAGFFVSRPLVGRASGKWSIQLTRRIDRPDGGFGGVAVISIDPFYFTSFYKEIDVGTRGAVTLVGLDGVVRARRAGGAMEVGQDVGASALFRRALLGAQGSADERSPIDGVLRRYSYRRLPGLPLIVVVGVERAEAMAGFEGRRLEYLAFAVGMSAVIVLFCLSSLWLVQRQRRIAERLAELRARAESANRLKSDFLASISHELRTPMNGVIGYAELLHDLSEGEELRQYAQVILDSSQHLLALLNSILDLARVEAGSLRLTWTSEAVDELVDKVCATYRALAASRGLELACSAPAGLRIVCDRTRVIQILGNLVHNALKFTDQGRVALSAEAIDGNCVFTVRDTGCGIPAELHEAIFERFRQGHAFETRSHGGAGLGLALCRELAELMNGTVTLESGVGEGSSFRLILPLGADEGRQ